MPVSVMMAEPDEKLLLQFETQELEVKADRYIDLLMRLFFGCLLSAKQLKYMGLSVEQH